MSRAWLEQRERGSQAAMRLMVWLTLKLGRRLTRPLLYPICLYFVLLSPRARHASRRFLDCALGRRARWRDIYRHYLTFASTLHDRIYFLSGRLDCFELHLHGVEALRAVIDRRQGCIMLGAHLGSFEALRALGTATEEVPLNVLAHLDNSARITRVLHAINPALAARIIPVGEADTLLAAQDCLERGEILAILGDRSVDGSKTTRCDFLGRPARFPEGPVLLAGLLKAPVVMCFGLYQGGRRYDIHFEVLAEQIRIERRNRAAATREWLSLYVQRLEHYSRLAPYNWFNFFDIWHDDTTDPIDPA